MLKPFVFLVLAAVLLLGCTQSSPRATATPSDAMQKESAMTEKSAVSSTPEAMKKETEVVEKSGEAMAEKKDAMVNADASAAPSGSALGGGFYEPFTPSRYDSARSEGKTVFLEFYANWCPVCKQQEPQIESAFDAITDERVVGFRVNYNDDQTDEDERNLAREFGVSYQHTHVLLDGAGTVKVKSLEFWDSSRVQAEVAQVAG